MDGIVWYIKDGVAKQGLLSRMSEEERKKIFCTKEDTNKYIKHLKLIEKEEEELEKVYARISNSGSYFVDEEIANMDINTLYETEILKAINEELNTQTLYTHYLRPYATESNKWNYRRMFKDDLQEILEYNNGMDCRSKLVYILENIFTEDCLNSPDKYCKIWSNVKERTKGMADNIYFDIIKKRKKDLVRDIEVNTLEEIKDEEIYEALKSGLWYKTVEDKIIRKIDPLGEYIDWEKILDKLED